MSAEAIGPHPTEFNLPFYKVVSPEEVVVDLFIIEIYNLLGDRTQDFVEHAYYAMRTRKPAYLRWVIEENGLPGLKGFTTRKTAPVETATLPKP